MATGLDFESYLISNESPIPKPVCLSWSVGNKKGLLIGEHMELFLKRQMEANELLIAHNATFETMVIYQHFPKLRTLLLKHLENGNFFCTALYQQLLDNLSKKQSGDMSLAGLVLKYYKIDISEDKKKPDAWRLRYSELDDIPLEEWPEEATQYAIMDSVYARKIYETQMRQNSSIIYKTHLLASYVLNIFASRGMLIDKERVQTLDKEINDILTPTYENLESQGFMKRDKKGKLSKNVSVLKEYICDNFERLMKTDKGAVKVSGEALDFYGLEKQDDVLKSFRYIGQYEKAKTAFVARLKTADPVIRTGYNAIVRSGRTSSRATQAYPSVNIQQQPRGLKGVTWDIRNCYIPRPGFKLVTIDYNNLELLSCANQLHSVYKKSQMCNIINSGTQPTDLHSVFACELMSSDKKRVITYEEFCANKKKEGWKEYRSKGKPVTLGVPGGMGYDTIRTQFNKEGINLPFQILQRCQYEVVARRLVRKYQSEYPSIRVKRTAQREWSVVFDEIVKLKKILFKLYPDLEMFLKEGHLKFVNGEFGFTKNEFGEWEKEPYYKYKTLGVERDYCTYTAFTNGFLMQAPSAVGAKLSGVNLFKEFDECDEVYPLAFIHDEYIFEIKDNSNLQKHVDRCAEIMIDSMKSVLSYVRVAVESEIKDYWSKDICLSARNYWKDKNSNELKYK